MEDDQSDIEGLAVETPVGTIIYVESTQCHYCGNQMDGVLVPKSDDAPQALAEGVPLCEHHYEGDDHFDTDSEWEWNSADD